MWWNVKSAEQMWDSRGRALDITAVIINICWLIALFTPYHKSKLVIRSEFTISGHYCAKLLLNIVIHCTISIYVPVFAVTPSPHWQIRTEIGGDALAIMPVRPRDGRQDWIPLYHIIKKSNSSFTKAFKLMYLTSEIVKFAGGRPHTPVFFIKNLVLFIFMQ